MEYIDKFIFFSGLILAFSILAGTLSNRASVPVLLIFLVIGMLFGEDGPGNIAFNNIPLSYLVCSIGLAIILFDGGLHTTVRQFKIGIKPALSLATIGVIITALVVAVFLRLILGIDFLPALLIGATVASTDAAAVFMMLHQQSIHLRHRIVATLEAESGLNDPMAVFLTIGIVEFMIGETQGNGLHLIVFFIQQMGIGIIVGVLGGRLIGVTMHRLTLPAGLYPILVIAGALMIFGGAALLHGSGFMAAYLAGLVVGNTSREPKTRAELSNFMDGMAWLSQIIMLLLLGLLVTPSRIIVDLDLALIAAVVLIFIARPLAVFISLYKSRFTKGEKIFISWVGLRGAVPIYLALIPSLMGVQEGYIYFHVAFAIVVLSLIVQGWTIKPMARLLGLQRDVSSEESAPSAEFHI